MPLVPGYQQQQQLDCAVVCSQFNWTPFTQSFTGFLPGTAAVRSWNDIPSCGGHPDDINALWFLQLNWAALGRVRTSATLSLPAITLTLTFQNLINSPLWSV